MRFSGGKCKGLHLGENNQKHKDKMGDDRLGNSDVEKDLGFGALQIKQQSAAQCRPPQKAAVVRGCIHRCIEAAVTGVVKY